MCSQEPAPKKQRKESPFSTPPAAPAGGQLRFWRVRLSGLPETATAAEVSDMLAGSSLTLPVEMIRLPTDRGHQLSPGEASFTLKVEAEATLAKSLGDGALGAGVSVFVEEVAAGADDELFIRYLPFVATPAEVEELFGAHGNIVKVKLMPGREPGLNSGVGFVTYTDPDTAAAAVAALDGASFMGRSLAVCLSKDRKAKRQPAAASGAPGGRLAAIKTAASAPGGGLAAIRERSGGAAGGACSNTPLVVPSDCRSVLVENLVYGCSQKDVRALFKKATKVVLLGKLGKARVGFLSTSDVKEACEQGNGHKQSPVQWDLQGIALTDCLCLQPKARCPAGA